jgi:hypothetical protein
MVVGEIRFDALMDKLAFTTDALEYSMGRLASGIFALASLYFKYLSTEYPRYLFNLPKTTSK